MKLNKQVEVEVREMIRKTIGTGNDKRIGKIEVIDFTNGVLKYRVKIGGFHIKTWHNFVTPIKIHNEIEDGAK